jgi:hypothetical protein
VNLEHGVTFLRDDRSEGSFPYVRLKKRIPIDHPPRTIRTSADDVLKTQRLSREDFQFPAASSLRRIGGSRLLCTQHALGVHEVAAAYSVCFELERPHPCVSASSKKSHGGTVAR